MPKEDGVVVPIDLEVRDLNLTKVESGALSKSLKKITDKFKVALNNIKAEPFAEKLSTVFGNTKPLEEWVGAYKAQMQEVDATKQKLEKAQSKLDKMDAADAKSKIQAEKNYQEFVREEREASNENFQKATQRYASAQSAYNRASTKEEKETRGKKLEDAKKYYEKLKDLRAQIADPNSLRNRQKAWNKEVMDAGGANRARGDYQKQQSRVEKLRSALSTYQDQLGATKEESQRFARLRELGKSLGIISDEQKNVNDTNKKMGSTHQKTSSGMKRNFKGLLKNVVMFGFGFRSLYFLVRRMRTIVKTDFAAMAMQFDDVNQPLSELLSSFKQLKASLGTMLEPIITVISPLLTQITDKLTDLTQTIAKFFAMLSGKNTIKVAKKELADFASEAGKAGNKLASYDQLSVISNNDMPEYVEQTFEVSETMQNIVSTIQTVLADLGSTVKPVMDMLSKIAGVWIDPIMEALPTVSHLITVIVDSLSAYVSKVAPVMKNLVQKLLPPILKIVEALEPLFGLFIEDILPVLLNLVDLLAPILVTIVETVGELMEPIVSIIVPLLQIITDILNPIISLLKPIVSLVDRLVKAVVAILKPILDVISPLLELIHAILEPISDLLTYVIFPILDDVLDAFGWLIELVSNINGGLTSLATGPFKLFVDMLKTAFGLITKLVGAIRDMFETTRNKGKSFINNIINGIEWLINKVVYGINWIIDKLNSVGFDLPDWMGGGHFGINISKIPDVRIPRLAQGAVIPPNKEFLAMLGDQRSGTNIEAPLDVIKQAFAEAIQENGGVNQPIILTLDGKIIAKAVWNENDKTYKQTGKSVYAM